MEMCEKIPGDQISEILKPVMSGGTMDSRAGVVAKQKVFFIKLTEHKTRNIPDARDQNRRSG